MQNQINVYHVKIGGAISIYHHIVCSLPIVTKYILTDLCNEMSFTQVELKIEVMLLFS